MISYFLFFRLRRAEYIVSRITLTAEYILFILYFLRLGLRPRELVYTEYIIIHFSRKWYTGYWFLIWNYSGIYLNIKSCEPIRALRTAPDVPGATRRCSTALGPREEGSWAFWWAHITMYSNIFLNIVSYQKCYLFLEKWIYNVILLTI